MVTAFCYQMGYTVEYVLNMPARRFFSMRIALDKIKAEEKSELLDIHAVNGISSLDYYKELKDNYLKQSIGETEYRKKKDFRVFDVDDPEQAKRVDDILRATFAVKSKVEGLA